jgi:hypothetical protein
LLLWQRLLFVARIDLMAMLRVLVIALMAICVA